MYWVRWVFRKHRSRAEAGLEEERAWGEGQGAGLEAELGEGTEVAGPGGALELLSLGGLPQPSPRATPLPVCQGPGLNAMSHF